MGRTAKSTQAQPHRWTTAAFAAKVHVTPQAVLKVVREHLRPPRKKNGTREHIGTGFPFTIDIVNGREAFRFDAGSLDWWEQNRGEKANGAAHGGKREGSGRPKRSDGDGGPSDAEDQTDPGTGGAPDETITQARKALVKVQTELKRRELDQLEGTLTPTADVRQKVREMVRSASHSLDAMASRVASRIARELGLDDTQRARLIEIVQEDVERTRIRLMGKREDEHAAG